ncbi:MAG: DNA-binding protein [Gemmataceae bacterium]|nr:DNA-binding protein [Gemmataceae bacterium]
MGQLIVRNLADELIQALRRRTARHGRSAEAEHREILRETHGSEVTRRSFKSVLARMPDAGDDADFSPQRDMPRKIRS